MLDRNSIEEQLCSDNLHSDSSAKPEWENIFTSPLKYTPEKKHVVLDFSFSLFLIFYTCMWPALHTVQLHWTRI